MNSEKVLSFFKEITKIPRESGHEEHIIAYLQGFAAERNLPCKTDEAGNVLITKEAAAGYEDVPVIVLQSHSDMVCEKNEGVDHDFAKDPIRYIIENGWMIAPDTTLGADCGIGVAAQLALLDSDMPCGKIECLFTTAEETGLDGAMALAPDADHPYLRVVLTPDGGSDTPVCVSTNLVGAYNADNVMAALAVGMYFGVPADEAVKAIEAYVPSNNRSQMNRTERNVLIVDAYNANPTSMSAALDNFANVLSDYKVAMLGDMLELGEDSLKEHEAVIAKASSLGLAGVFFVGKEFIAASGNRYDPEVYFETSDQLALWLEEHPLDGATVLIKGSRGTRMEKVIPML